MYSNILKSCEILIIVVMLMSSCAPAEDTLPTLMKLPTDSPQQTLSPLGEVDAQTVGEVEATAIPVTASATQIEPTMTATVTPTLTPSATITSTVIASDNVEQADISYQTMTLLPSITLTNTALSQANTIIVISTSTQNTAGQSSNNQATATQSSNVNPTSTQRPIPTQKVNSVVVSTLIPTATHDAPIDPVISVTASTGSSSVATATLIGAGIKPPTPAIPVVVPTLIGVGVKPPPVAPVVIPTLIGVGVEPPPVVIPTLIGVGVEPPSP